MALNAWSIFGYLTVGVGGVWGAHPADDAHGSRSGVGFVGNQFELQRVVKQVVRGPPLTTAPVMDLTVQIPSAVMDALHAATVATSVGGGVARAAGLLCVRAVQAAVRWLPGLSKVGYFHGPPLGDLSE